MRDFGDDPARVLALSGLAMFGVLLLMDSRKEQQTLNQVQYPDLMMR